MCDSTACSLLCPSKLWPLSCPLYAKATTNVKGEKHWKHQK